MSYLTIIRKLTT